MQYCRGFSLIEVLLGISVFMIGMLGVTALNISSLKSNTFSGNLSEATLIAATKMTLTEMAPARIQTMTGLIIMAIISAWIILGPKLTGQTHPRAKTTSIWSTGMWRKANL